MSLTCRHLLLSSVYTASKHIEQAFNKHSMAVKRARRTFQKSLARRLLQVPLRSVWAAEAVV